MSLVRKLDQIEVGIRNQDILGLPSDPTTHINISVGPTGTTGVHIQANACLLLSTGAASPASNVERNCDQVTDFQILNVITGFDDFARDLVTKDHPRWSGGTTPYHVLVRTAYVGRDHLQNDTVLNVFPRGVLHRRKVNGLNFDFILSEINDSTVLRHCFSPCFRIRRKRYGCRARQAQRASYYMP